MNIVGIITARMASSRFPGKPMALINGIPMIGHVYMRSKMSKTLKKLYVATCDNEIFDYIESIGGNTIMTSNTHQRASDRAAEAMIKIETITREKIDVLVLIQGDEPMLYPEMIDMAVSPIIENDDLNVVNLMAELKTREEQIDPNEVKVVTDKNHFALYFSREPIPSRRYHNNNVPMFKQVCIIPFKRDFLIEFNRMEQTPLEVIESIDMLRIIENGHKVKLVPIDFETYSVDTINDLNKVEKLMKKDKLVENYCNVYK